MIPTALICAHLFNLEKEHFFFRQNKILKQKIISQLQHHFIFFLQVDRLLLIKYYAILL